MSASQETDVQDIDHLGIIAGIVDAIGIVEIVDSVRHHLQSRWLDE